MKCEYNAEQLSALVEKQIGIYWNFRGGGGIKCVMPRVLGRLEKNLSSWNSKYCRENDETVFHIEHTVTYSVFLYLLSNQLYKEGFEQSAAYVYYLNKIMHSVDWFYAIELPDYFGAEHPLSSVLGRAEYSNYFFIYQGVTVGGNRKADRLYYPKIGENVILYSDSKVLGDVKIGNNVVISANTYIKDAVIPDNSIVFGSSPNLIIKKKTESEMQEMTGCFWNRSMIKQEENYE